MENRDLLELIKKIVIEETKFLRNYLGKVTNNQDEKKQGKILVQIPGLIWTTDDKACWCTPVDKNSLITPKIGDWVIVTFEEGDSTKPYYLGFANNIKDVLSTKFDGLPATQVIYSYNDNSYMVFDSSTGKLIIKMDKGIEINCNNNKIEMNDNGIKLTDKNSNTIEMTTSEIKINGTNLEVLQ